MDRWWVVSAMVRFLKSPFVLAHRLLLAVAVVTIVASFALLVAFAVYGDVLEKHTSGERPTQFYQELDEDLLDDYGGVFGVAHNSGDGLRATREAIAHGADVIEIDVVAVNGELYAAHAPPRRWYGARTFRGPALETVWAASAAAYGVELDLKGSGPAYLDLVFAFLAAHRDGRQVLVATRDEPALRAFAERAPEVFRLLSVGSQTRLTTLRTEPDLVALIDGVTVREDLLDADSAAWLEERGLIVLAWTVNDLARVNALVRLGVDAITTDNLAIMRLLGGQDRGERPLVRRAEPTPTVHDLSAVGTAGAGGATRRRRPGARRSAGPTPGASRCARR